MSEYAAVSALLFLALYSTQRITQNLHKYNLRALHNTETFAKRAFLQRSQLVRFLISLYRKTARFFRIKFYLILIIRG